MLFRGGLDLHCRSDQMLRFDVADGRAIEIKGGLNRAVEFDCAMSRLVGKDGNSENIDALGFQIWLPDEQGSVWTTQLKISAEFLEHQMCLASTNCAMELSLHHDLEDHQKDFFDLGTVAQGIRFFCDDRCVRRLILRHSIYPLCYKYREIHFDVSVTDWVTWNAHRFGPDWKVGFPESATWEKLIVVSATFDMCDADTQQIEWFEQWRPDERLSSLPRLTFFLENGIETLFRGHRATVNRDGFWEESLTPQPIVFEASGLSDSPQPGVAVA